VQALIVGREITGLSAITGRRSPNRERSAPDPYPQGRAGPIQAARRHGEARPPSLRSSPRSGEVEARQG